ERPAPRHPEPTVEDDLGGLWDARRRRPIPFGNPARVTAARLNGDRSSALAMGHEALTAAVAISAQARIADVLEDLAGVAADLGRSEEAAHLYGASRAQRDLTGYARCVTERDAQIEALRVAGAPDAFDDAYKEGRALSLDDAVAYAGRNRGERRRP